MNLAEARPELVDRGLGIIAAWRKAELSRSPFPDPLDTVLNEGGPFHATYNSPDFEGYKRRLCDTGRERFAADLDARKKKWEDEQKTRR